MVAPNKCETLNVGQGSRVKVLRDCVLIPDVAFDWANELIAVGTSITGCPPHRSRRA
jgi:hypothetical protein